MPCMIGGHSLGVLLGPTLPAAWIESFAVVVLLIAALKTMIHAREAYARECEVGEAARESLQVAATATELAKLSGGPSHGVALPHGDVDVEGALPGGRLLRHDMPAGGHAATAAADGGAFARGEDVAAGRTRRTLEPSPLASRPVSVASLASPGLAKPGMVNTATSPIVPLWGPGVAAPSEDPRWVSEGPRSEDPRSDDPRWLSASGGAVGRADEELRGLDVHAAPSTSSRPPSSGVATAPAAAPLRGGPPMPIDGGRIMLLLVVWLLFAADYRLADASNQACKHFGRCVLPYASLRLTVYAALAFVVVLSVRLILRSHLERAEHGVEVLRGDLVWQLRTTVGTLVLAVLVGTIAGLLGLGGGELMAPLLVHLGMLPEVAAACNAFIILFTSSADLEHYTDNGVLQLYADSITRPGYVVSGAVIGFTAALLGRTAAVRCLAKLRHPSLLLFLLGGTLVLSALLLVGRVLQENRASARLVQDIVALRHGRTDIVDIHCRQ